MHFDDEDELISGTGNGNVDAFMEIPSERKKKNNNNIIKTEEEQQDDYDEENQSSGYGENGSPASGKGSEFDNSKKKRSLTFLISFSKNSKNSIRFSDCFFLSVQICLVAGLHRVGEIFGSDLPKNHRVGYRVSGWENIRFRVTRRPTQPCLVEIF